MISICGLSYPNWGSFVKNGFMQDRIVLLVATLDCFLILKVEVPSKWNTQQFFCLRQPFFHKSIGRQ